MEINSSKVYLHADLTLKSLLSKKGGRPPKKATIIYDDKTTIYEKKTHCLSCKHETENKRGLKILSYDNVMVETPCNDCGQRKSVFQSINKLPLNIQRNLNK